MLLFRSCSRCRAGTLQVAQLKRQNSMQMRHQSSKQIDVANLLSKPTWSVKSLLPTPQQLEDESEITTKELTHLLRLSALPHPDTWEEKVPGKKNEQEMIKTLRAQLHFVRQIQEVDTTGVEPLVAIRDETKKAKEETTIGLNDPAIQEALKNEEIKGKNMRPRRNRNVEVDTKGAEDWDALGTAKKTVGRYFVVDSSNSDIPRDGQ